MFLASHANKELRGYKLCISFALLSLILVQVVNCILAVEPAYSMFQRSGALITVFGVLAEFYSSRLQSVLYGTSEIDVAALEYVKAQPKWFKYRLQIAHTVVVVGTLIWGFGDLPFK